MPITKKYSLAAVQLDDDTDVLIRGITSQGLDTNTEVDVEATSGEVYPRWHAVTGVNPAGQFGTYHLATAFGAIGLPGLDVSTLATGLNLWLQKHAQAGTRAAGASHAKYAFSAGLLVMGNLSVPFGGDGILTCRLHTVSSDGSTVPFTITPDQALPPADPEDDERFALGPVTIGGKTLTQIRQLEIDFGVSVQVERGDFDKYPTFISIETVAPRITLSGIDPDWLADAGIPLGGLAGTKANTSIYLKKRTSTGFVGDDGSEHIKFTAAGVAYIDSAFSAQGPAAAESSLVMAVGWDGVNEPIVIATNADIT